MLWLHCDVTGMMGKPLSFPGRPESQLSFHSCEKRWKHLYFLILRWNLWWSFAKLIQWCYMFSGPAESYVPLWSMRPTAWDLNSEPFPFMVSILFWWYEFFNAMLSCFICDDYIYILYKWLYVCRYLFRHIMFKTNKHIHISSHQFNMCSWFDHQMAQGVEGRSRRSRPSTAGCAGSEKFWWVWGKLMEMVGNPVYLWRFWGNFWPNLFGDSVIRISVASSTVI